MARPYSPEELMRLRESPLVCKPAGLPPVEEWMGPIAEQNQAQNQNQRRAANKGKNEEAFPTDGTTTRRPLFEVRSKSTNVPEDIVLGPPKTAFASASSRGNTNKHSEAPQRSSFTNHDDAGVKNDRSNFRDRYSKDGEKPRDTRPGTATNRRSVKDDSDLWSNVRQPRTPGQEDGERTYRRNGDRDYDRDREGGRESRMQRGFENYRRDGDRDFEGENGARRGPPGRSRNEPSWYRDEGRQEEDGTEGSGAPRHRDWERRGTRGTDRDWGRGTKPETDPEWMDAPEAEEQTQGKTSETKTSEDFERWKKQMKTGNSATQDVPLSLVEQRPSHAPTASGGATGIGRAKVDTPLVVDSSFDKDFFGLWKEPGKSKEVTNRTEDGAPPLVASTGAKAPRPSKFTGFFNPRPDLENLQQPPLSLVTQSQDSSNEDKEGFQRILKLLDQQQQPQNGKITTPPRGQAQREEPVSPPVQSPRAGEPNDLFSLLKTSSPQGNSVPQTRDSEFLLNLMHQPQQGRHDIIQPNPSGRRTAPDTTPGLSQFSNLTVSSNETAQPQPSMGPPPGFFDDAPSRDKLNPGAERRGPPPGFFDPGKPQRPSPVGAPQQSAYPPGIQRPPGLESLPYGYAQHVQPQRQAMVPPPGFQALRGQNSFPPGLFPNSSNQFGMPATGRGVLPPGFMNAPPPGFPLPFSQEGLPFSPFSDGGNFGQGGFGQQRRQ